MHSTRTSYFGLLLVLLLSYESFSQNAYQAYKKRKVRAEEYASIDGSPYLYDEWLKAEVIAANGKVFTDEKVNYNAYTQELEHYEANEVKEMITGSYLKVSFLTDDGRQVFMRGLHPELGMDLVCVLYDGKSVDFAKKVIVIVQDYDNPNTGRKFIPSTEYFIIKEGRLSWINLKKKKILSVFEDHYAELEKYLEDNNLKLRSEAEVIKFLDYYESLAN